MAEEDRRREPRTVSPEQVIAMFYTTLVEGGPQEVVVRRTTGTSLEVRTKEGEVYTYRPLTESESIFFQKNHKPVSLGNSGEPGEDGEDDV